MRAGSTSAGTPLLSGRWGAAGDAVGGGFAQPEGLRVPGAPLLYELSQRHPRCYPPLEKAPQARQNEVRCFPLQSAKRVAQDKHCEFHIDTRDVACSWSTVPSPRGAGSKCTRGLQTSIMGLNPRHGGAELRAALRIHASPVHSTFRQNRRTNTNQDRHCSVACA